MSDETKGNVSDDPASSVWLKKWEPENNEFWFETGSKLAWKTLTISTLDLILGFSTWFILSIIVLHLVGLFKLDEMQKWWILSVVGLSSGSLRIIHTFLIPIYGTRSVISITTLLLAIPCVGWAYAVQNAETTPYWMLLVLAFLTGFGGGNFSSFMPSTSLFFPKRLQGTALGIQAGVGNFGVSLAQFVIPWAIGFAMFGDALGGSQTIKPKLLQDLETLESYAKDPSKTPLKSGETAEEAKVRVAGELASLEKKLAEKRQRLETLRGYVKDPATIPLESNETVKAATTRVTKDMKKLAAEIEPKILWLQNAALIWMPFILVGGVAAWFTLRSVPIRASFAQQLDIFKDKHTWFMTSLYIMTFGSFSGYSAAFPSLIRDMYGKFGADAPNPMVYAFLGPLVGALIRVVFGPVSDKFGGAVVTQISGIGLTVCALIMPYYSRPTSVDEFPIFLWLMLGIFFFSGVGNASTFRQIPIIFPPRQAGGVLGWTGAIAAYGPLIIPALVGTAIAQTKTETLAGSPAAFFYGAAVFYAFNCVLNWWYYQRRGAEKPC